MIGLQLHQKQPWPKTLTGTFALSFSMFSGQRNWGQNYNLALKLERSYHKEHMCTKFQVDWISASSKTT